MITIREIRQNDAEHFLALSVRLDEESSFMLLEPGERTTTLEQQERQIQAVVAQANQMIFVAEENGRLVGYIAGLGGGYNRNRHKADIVIGIRASHTGQGLGTKLFIALEQWAAKQKLHKLELTVMAHNERAIHLYQKMGFVVEGVAVDSLVVNGHFVDELDMAKILKSKNPARHRGRAG